MSTVPTVIKKLSFIWKVGGHDAVEIEMRPSTMRDVCAAESSASPMRPNSFAVEMASQQIVRAGAFDGPFVSGQFMNLSPAQFAEINAAAQEADQLGKD